MKLNLKKIKSYFPKFANGPSIRHAAIHAVSLNTTRFFVLLLFFSCLGFSCSSFKTPKDPETLIYHLGAEPATLNPLTGKDAYESRINAFIYESLLDRDNQTQDWIPRLAESWQVSPDKKKITFKLKKEILWQDGKLFTVDDVIYTYERLIDPKVDNPHQKGDYLESGIVFKKLDEHTVICEAAKPYFKMMELCGGMLILPQHVFDDGQDFNSHSAGRFPVGTGPYRFVEWKTNKRIVILRNEDYWDTARLPQIKKILFKIIADDTVALQELKKGDLDLASMRPIQWVKQTTSKQFQTLFARHEYYAPSYRYIAWNMRKPLFQDKRVRRALTMLINREAIVNKLEYGLGKVISGPFFFQSADYNSAIEPWPYDPNAAKKLLEEAGWKEMNSDGIRMKEGQEFRFQFLIPSGVRFYERLATLMKEDFRKAGIGIDIQTLEWALFTKKLDTHEFDAVSLAWGLGVDSDPFSIWHSSFIEKGFNFAGFKNEEADEILLKAREVFDRKERAAMYHRFHEIVHEEQPYTFLYTGSALTARSARFRNVKVYPGGIDLLEWKLFE